MPPMMKGSLEDVGGVRVEAGGLPTLKRVATGAADAGVEAADAGVGAELAAVEVADVFAASIKSSTTELGGIPANLSKSGLPVDWAKRPEPDAGTALSIVSVSV